LLITFNIKQCAAYVKYNVLLK